MKKIILSSMIITLFLFSNSTTFAQGNTIPGATTKCSCSSLWGLSSCEIECTHLQGGAACLTVYGMCECLCGGAHAGSTNCFF